MPARDRTAEFHSVLSSIRARTAAPPSKGKGKDVARQPLLSDVDGSGRASPAGHAGGSKSEFGRMAGGIAKDINATTLKLQKLAQLAKRKTLFDDRPVEISELTYIIRQDIAALNTSIASLRSYVSAQKPGGSGGGGAGASGAKVVEEHNKHVVMMLQSRLANMGLGFKDVLEMRTQNMKASKDRTEQFMHTASSAAVAPPAANSLLLAPQQAQKPRRASPAPLDPAVPGSGMGSGAGAGEERDFLVLDIDGDRGESAMGGGYQQMQLVEQQDNYIQSRSSAIETVESTIAELGQIFSQLANMVAEQRETVQRIDADVTDISANVTGAQRELLKYYASISSNRWLMLKIFGVLIIFFLVFILVS
ncbi:Integral membrane protein SED5 [Cryptotrichosporon argae]